MKIKFTIFFILSLSSFIHATDRPNILFILADDQSPFDLKIYDPKSPLDTPALDKLAKEGVVFDAAHHMGSNQGAVCNPSRHMIMSGRTVWHLPHGSIKKLAPNSSQAEKDAMCPSDLANFTMAAVFNKAGYDTMRTCKNGNSYPQANEKFTVRHDATKRGATDLTGSAWHGQQVLNYLNQREKTKDQDPFLIYYGFSHPHDNREGKPELLRKYGATNQLSKDHPPQLNPEIPTPKLQSNYLARHPFPHGHPGLRDEVHAPGIWERRDEATIRNELGREYACSENIDIQIGRVLEKLEAMGELDNTYIIYTSDHGIAIGRHGLQGKQNLYEHTFRVPFIVKGPGIPAGKRVKGNIYLLDVLSTLCDLANVPIPKTNEGLSFKDVLIGKKETVRDSLYGVYAGGTKPGMRCVKKGDWKLIKYDTLDGTVRKTQLFNLKENPDELLLDHHQQPIISLTGNTPKPTQINLAKNPLYSRKLAEMEQALLMHMRDFDDPYRLWNQADEGLVKKTH
ncbi:sulfatase-like hydrolase/transferase [Lentisphaera profundi]|uniref:Sulfatase-like hydrolase/transferase n=1 Tax=Lentisphaera profundi TaxID=1658616 RepID=A0ABY7VWM6_9BACT|nr:sulfatase-like hydrolase/transferase [Lentisphaera profundi]WDE98610.1 sulfatase-like hydrolase/transferase [Lentisphaera profundi]